MPTEESLTVIGVKPNSSYFHNTMRIIVLFILIVILIMLYYSGQHCPRKAIASIHDIEHVIRPGTKMYDIIMEMDEDDRIVYIASMGKILNDMDQTSKFKKILKAVTTTLLVGFTAEYIMHGNVSKVISTTGKTGLSATLTALA